MRSSNSQTDLVGQWPQFEALLSELSATFTELPAERVDGEISQALKRIVESLGNDRTTFLEFSEDKRQLHSRYSYAVPGHQPFPGTVLDDKFPWYTGKLRHGEVIVMERLPEGLPDKAVAERQYCIEAGFKANLSIPLSVGGEIVAAIAIGSFTNYQEWPDELIQRLRVIGEVFVNALGRKRADNALRTSEAMSSAVFQDAPVVMLLLDANLDIRRMNRAAEELVGGSERELAGLASGNVMHCIHSLHDPNGCGHGPCCQECPARRTIRDTLETGRMHQEEVQLTLQDGQQQRDTCLILSTGVIELPHGRRVLVCIQDITQRKQAETGLREALAKIEQLKERLQLENIVLREEIKVRYGHEEIVGKSDTLRRAIAQAEQVADTDATVLLTGETGTGKELLARAIHGLSPRKDAPMVVVNCAAIPPTLVEGELFGREAGAYTGAMSKQLGRFEVADGSTLFLDEVGELPLELQGKLLRAIEEGTFERLGSPETISVDVRVIAATNRDLAKALRDGTFREDLYHRLSVFPIHVPPLRERQGDIPLLVWTFVHEFGEKMGKMVDAIPRRTMESLERYPWPGNVRELRNVIERAMILSNGPVLRVEIPSHSGASSDEDMTLDELQRRHILRMLERTGWRIRGTGGAAEILGLKPTTLETRMAKLGIRRPGKASNMGNRKQ